MKLVIFAGESLYELQHEVNLETWTELVIEDVLDLLVVEYETDLEVDLDPVLDLVHESGPEADFECDSEILIGFDDMLKF